MKKQTMIEFPGGGASCNPAPVRVFLKFAWLGLLESFLGDLFSQTRSLARYRFENKSPKTFLAKKSNNNETNSSPFTVYRLLINETDFSRFTSHFSPLKKPAFTMAEVLITLGVIGIVVAMTLPTLINKIQGYVLQTQFKKAYNMISVALVKMKADYSIDNLHREFVIYNPSTSYYRSNEFKEMFYKTIGADRVIPLYKVKNYNLTKDYEYFYVDYPTPIHVLNNGVSVETLITSGHILIAVDINGYQKGPNAYGHDIFRFDLDTNDALRPCKMTRSYTEEELENLPYPEQAGYPCSINSKQRGNGIGCAWYAFENINPDDNSKTYWDNLPK